MPFYRFPQKILDKKLSAHSGLKFYYRVAWLGMNSVRRKSADNFLYKEYMVGYLLRHNFLFPTSSCKIQALYPIDAPAKRYTAALYHGCQDASNCIRPDLVTQNSLIVR